MCSGSPLKSRTSILQLSDTGKAQQPSSLPLWLQLLVQSLQTLPYRKAALSSPGALEKSCFSFLPIDTGAFVTGKQKAQADAAQHCHLQSHPRRHAHGCVAPR